MVCQGGGIGLLNFLLLMKIRSKVWNGYEYYKMMIHQ